MTNSETIQGSVAASGPVAAVRRSLLGSKSLWAAILITLLGAASWAYSVATRDTPQARTPATSALAASDAPETRPSERLLDRSAPATVRYGLSFIVAFLVGYAVKRIIKSVLIIASLVVALIAALKYLGIFDYDWTSAQQQVEQGVELAKQESGRLAKLVSDYLPSSVAAGFGAIMGSRRG